MQQSSSSPAPASLARLDGRSGARRHFRLFDYAMVAFVAILLLSNLIGAAKLSWIDVSGAVSATPWLPWHWLVNDSGKMLFGAGILFFPVSYVLGDVLTEVYGYANARRCVWAGFFALIFMAFMSFVVVAMPSAAEWGCAQSGDPAYAGLVRASSAGAVCQSTYVSVFGSTWRIVLASLLAFWAGEFVNSFVLARMKVMTEGRFLWMRTIGSTVFGEGVDSLIFYPVAFLGTWETHSVVVVMVTNWALKVTWEVVLTPVTYAVVGFLKRHEGVDVFDDNTDFSPFAKAPVA
ncbi:queuosine precursor transporter [Novosphingobium colocasiae]|uniref:queuosine precursor transporter n=1 Tax=Novosphingobium colocasiae TaxID=1256513 RepID=UPI0035B19BB6